MSPALKASTPQADPCLCHLRCAITSTRAIRSLSPTTGTNEPGSCRVRMDTGSAQSQPRDHAPAGHLGLLIRGFGVQVPGGAPVLTWCYYDVPRPRNGRSGPVVARSLVCTDRVSPPK